jgi:hypothetical protein
MTATQRWMVLLIMYAVFLTVAIAALLAVLGYFPKADPRFVQWAVPVLFADVVAAAIAVFKTHFGTKEARVYINLVFDGVRPTEVDLESCKFVVHNGESVLKKEGSASLIKGPGGWQCQFSWQAEASDTARLDLTERSGKKWRIASFSPTTVEQHAVLA